MTDRHRMEVAFFCLPEELLRLLGPILDANRAQLCIASERGRRFYFRKALFPEDLKALDPRFYTPVTTMTGSCGVDSLANVTQVWLPVPSDGRIRMGRVALLVTKSEFGEELRQSQERVYRDIRKALTKDFRRGVIGRNSKTGGEHFYKGILVSDQAVRAYENGTVLATTMGDGFVTYHVPAG